jgi:hypothetical protein
MSKSDAGKGDKPRNCFTKQFKVNHDKIKWNSKLLDPKLTKTSKGKKTYKY